MSQTRAKRVLIIHEVLPHFDQSGSDLRMLQIIQSLRAQGHAVTYIARDGRESDRYKPNLEELGVKVFAGDAERLQALGLEVVETWCLQEVLESGQFHMAILFHWFWNGLSVTEQYLDDLRRLSPQTRILILTDDRHWKRQSRAAQVSGELADYARALDFRNREVECYTSADLVLVISKTEQQELLALLPDLNVELLPMSCGLMGDANCSCCDESFSTRRDFLFLGNFKNRANQDAVRWFCHDIWPGIKLRIPQAELHLAGHAASDEISVPNEVAVIGHVPNLEEVLRKYRVFVSPLRVGTGIKTKNVMAMKHALPVLTTTIGAEGMELCDGETAMIADTAAQFIEKATQLYTDRHLWERIQRGGLRHIEKTFSVAHLNACLSKVIERAEATAPQAFDSRHRFSMMRVEETHPQVVRYQPANMRIAARIWSHVARAGRYLELQRPELARQELFHTLSLTLCSRPSTQFLAMIFNGIERCSYEMGEVASAAGWARETERFAEEARVAQTVSN